MASGELVGRSNKNTKYVLGVLEGVFLYARSGYKSCRRRNISFSLDFELRVGRSLSYNTSHIASYLRESSSGLTVDMEIQAQPNGI